jgi:DNA-binding MarR family transcriptional regulator
MAGDRRAWLRYSVLAAQREGNRILARALRPLGLTPSQAEVLAVLADHGPLSVEALGGLLVCETGSPSRLAGSLVAKGHAQRRADPGDLRRTLVALTVEGRAAAARVRAVEDAFYGALGDVACDPAAPWDALATSWLRDTPSGLALRRRGLWPEDMGRDVDPSPAGAP